MASVAGKRHNRTCNCCTVRQVTIARQHSFRRDLLKQIARRCTLPGAGDILAGLILREKERYLTSHAVQSSVLCDIWQRDHTPEVVQNRWKLAQRRPVIPHSYRRFRSAPVSYFHKARSTEGARKICRFSDVEKMWHGMARDLIVAQHTPRPHIGDWSGRGRDWQIDQIMSVLTSPRQAVVCADVTRAFASVNIDAVYELPYLPEPLIRRAIDYRSHQFIRRERSEYVRDVHLAIRNEYDGVLERSPSGLMEGSPASNAIFSVLLDDLPDHLEEGIQAFVYCDNIVLIAPSMSRALRANDALVRYFTGHRAGPFEMRSSVARVSERFEHLGYTIRRLPGLPPDVGIARNGWLKLVARLFSEPRDVGEALKWLKASYGRCYYSSLREFLHMANCARSRPH
jgi:hypothetical protein